MQCSEVEGATLGSAIPVDGHRGRERFLPLLSTGFLRHGVKLFAPRWGHRASVTNLLFSAAQA